ncbi:hypothetical protein AOG2_31370 [Geobacter sp. AOG2]|nr:hypothetical protein AOG2_31370 [Geobacter sp. AOG2]
MKEDSVTVFCISCGFVSTVSRGEMPRKMQRMVCPKCRYSFHLANRVAEEHICSVPASGLTA